MNQIDTDLDWYVHIYTYFKYIFVEITKIVLKKLDSKSAFSEFLIQRKSKSLEFTFREYIKNEFTLKLFLKLLTQWNKLQSNELERYGFRLICTNIYFKYIFVEIAKIVLKKLDSKSAYSEFLTQNKSKSLEFTFREYIKNEFTLKLFLELLTQWNKLQSNELERYGFRLICT